MPARQRQAPPAPAKPKQRQTTGTKRTKRTQAAPQPMPVAEPVRKLLYTTREAAAALGICEKTLYKHLLSGSLFSLRIGATRRIPIAALEAYIARQMSESGHLV